MISGTTKGAISLKFDGLQVLWCQGRLYFKPHQQHEESYCHEESSASRSGKNHVRTLFFRFVYFSGDRFLYRINSIISGATKGDRSLKFLNFLEHIETSSSITSISQSYVRSRKVISLVSSTTWGNIISSTSHIWWEPYRIFLSNCLFQWRWIFIYLDLY